MLNISKQCALQIIYYFFLFRNGSTVNSLRYLTVSQALEDTASFIMFVKKLYKLEKNKVVVFGASYGGTLAALFRRKYPHIAAAGVGLSAPMFREYQDKGEQ